jgi:hypothetical protein
MEEPGTGELLRSFLAAVGTQWLAVFVGGLLIAAMGLWERLTGYDIPTRWYGIVALACLFYACFLAWREEHIRWLKNQPALTLDVNQTWVTSRAEGGGVDVFMLGEVRNSGMPTIAEGWLLDVYDEGLLIQRVAPSLIPDKLEFYQGDVVVGTFHGKEALYERTLKPIAQGDVVRGWLHFQLPTAKYAQFRAGHTVLTLSCVDVGKQRHEARYTLPTGGMMITPGNVPGFMVPGAEYPFQRP